VAPWNAISSMLPGKEKGKEKGPGVNSTVIAAK
jgi:hypothetical protein